MHVGHHFDAIMPDFFRLILPGAALFLKLEMIGGVKNGLPLLSSHC